MPELIDAPAAERPAEQVLSWTHVLQVLAVLVPLGFWAYQQVWGFGVDHSALLQNTSDIQADRKRIDVLEAGLAEIVSQRGAIAQLQADDREAAKEIATVDDRLSGIEAKLEFLIQQVYGRKAGSR